MWTSFENTILRKISQARKVTYCMIPSICNVQNRQIYRDGKISGFGGGEVGNRSDG